jgi:hypothetical protein
MFYLAETHTPMHSDSRILGFIFKTAQRSKYQYFNRAMHSDIRIHI